MTWGALQFTSSDLHPIVGGGGGGLRSRRMASPPMRNMVVPLARAAHHEAAMHGRLRCWAGLAGGGTPS
jgi:hypothetical protein